jgi:hypothetical protein
MLTPKVEEHFSNWLIANAEVITLYVQIDENKAMEYDEKVADVFERLLLSMQFGIYEDYFEKEHGLIIDVDMSFDDGLKYYIPCIEKVNYFGLSYVWDGKPTKDKDKARKAVIEKASKLAEEKVKE